MSNTVKISKSEQKKLDKAAAALLATNTNTNIASTDTANITAPVAPVAPVVPVIEPEAIVIQPAALPIAPPEALKVKGAVKNPPKASNGKGAQGPRASKGAPTLNILNCSYAHWTKFASKIANGSLIWDSILKTFVQIEIAPIASHIRFGKVNGPLYKPELKKGDGFYAGVVVCSANNIETLLKNIETFYAQTPDMLDGMDLSKTNWKNPFTELEGDSYMPTVAPVAAVAVAKPAVTATAAEPVVADTVAE